MPSTHAIETPPLNLPKPVRSPLRCPACRRSMQRILLPRRPRGEVELDLCIDCRGIWFDQFESSQLTPTAAEALFQLIHLRPEAGHAIRHEHLQCPRCADRLIHGADLSKNGRFAYDRCPHWHGRFTTFASFLLEKGFTRQLAKAELEVLAAEVGAFQCPNCGAPLDVQHHAACQYCGTRITILERRLHRAASAFAAVARDQKRKSPR